MIVMISKGVLSLTVVYNVAHCWYTNLSNYQLKKTKQTNKTKQKQTNKQLK